MNADRKSASDATNDDVLGFMPTAVEYRPLVASGTPGGDRALNFSLNFSLPATGEQGLTVRKAGGTQQEF